MGDSSACGMTTPLSQDSSSRTLKRRVRDIMMYDVAFCLYVFFFVLSSSFQFRAFSLHLPDKDSFQASAAAVLLILFSVLTTVYLGIWLLNLILADCCCCCVCCVPRCPGLRRPRNVRF